MVPRAKTDDSGDYTDLESGILLDLQDRLVREDVLPGVEPILLSTLDRESPFNAPFSQ